MRRLWNSIKGSPHALARLIAVALGIIATIAGDVLPIGGLSHVGDAFLGAAVAMFMDLLARQLQEADQSPAEKSPALKDFVTAIQKELSGANFYRERQIITISVDDEGVSLDFDSDIKLIDTTRPAIIRKQNILDVPVGLEVKKRMIFRLGRDFNYPDNLPEQPVSQDTSDHIEVRYSFSDENRREFEDNHIWASLVRDYKIVFISKKYRCEVTKVRGKTVVSGLVENPPGTFHSAGAAFPGEQVRWKLIRI